MRIVLALLVLLLGLVALFAIQNPGIITVRLLNIQGDTSLLVVIVAAFGAGLLAGFLAGIPATLRRQRRVRELQQEVEALRKGSVPPPATP